MSVHIWNQNSLNYFIGWIFKISNISQWNNLDFYQVSGWPIKSNRNINWPIKSNRNWPIKSNILRRQHFTWNRSAYPVQPPDIFRKLSYTYVNTRKIFKWIIYSTAFVKGQKFIESLCCNHAMAVVRCHVFTYDSFSPHCVR